MDQSRIVEHVYAQLWPQYGRPSHPEDVAALRDTIAEVVGHAIAHLDTHPQTCRCVRATTTNEP